MKYDIRRYWQALQWWYIYQHNKVTASSSSTLLNSLVAYWKLDETSGTRFDSAGSNHLSDVNGVGSAPGVVGNAASFTGTSNEYLSEPSTPDLQQSGSFTISGWFQRLAVNNSVRVLLAKTNEYFLGFVSGKLRFQVYNSSGSGSTALNANAFSYSASTWYHVVAWYDADAQTINMLVDNTLSFSIGHTGGVLASSADFWIGRLASFYYIGYIDEVGIWKRVLTPAERTQLYNSGSGFTYPFV